MTHTPNLDDAATDLIRCTYFANYEKFLTSAEKIITINKNLLTQTRLNQIKNYIERAKDTKLNLDQKREHLLTASILLQNSHKMSS